MTMFMYKEQVIAVTNRKLCRDREAFLCQIKRICKNQPHAVILREKDLSESEYTALLFSVKKICEEHKVSCIAHTYTESALEAGCTKIHVPLAVLEANPEIAQKFEVTGVSTHSKEDAKKAQKLGASYVTAGHIFATTCKPGLEPRGTAFLKEVCDEVEIPVFAIGGMKTTRECVEEMRKLGASGICVMSECMKWI